MVECGRKRRQKKFECADCDYATSKKSDMGRHRRTRHNETVSVTADSGTDDWEQLDPGNMSDVVGSTPQQPHGLESCPKKADKTDSCLRANNKVEGFSGSSDATRSFPVSTPDYHSKKTIIH